MKSRNNLFALVGAIVLLLFSPLYFYMISLKITDRGLSLTILVFIYMTHALSLLLYHQIQMKRRYQSIRRARFYNNFYELVKETTNLEVTDEIYMTILETALKCMDTADKGSILLMDHDTGLLHYAAAVGYDFDILKSTYIELEQLYLYKETGGNIQSTVKINNPIQYDKENFAGENIELIFEAGTDGIMTTLSTPIFINDKLYGVINIDSGIINDFTDTDEEVLEFFALELRHMIKHRRSLEKNHYLTNFDTLTNIANRHYIHQLLKECHENAALKETGYLLVVIDLDNLKRVNDNYGHDAGDTLITTFTGTMVASIGDGCHFGRNGSDEFLLVIPGGSLEKINQTMCQIRSYLKEMKLSYDNQVPGCRTKLLLWDCELSRRRHR